MIKNYVSFILTAIFMLNANLGFAEKPVQHLILPDITSYPEAKKVFLATTAELKTKTELNANELHDIHIITYSLEKAVAYFVQHLDSVEKSSINTLAEVIELIHIGSENNRKEETKIYLETYFNLAESLKRQLD